MTCSEKTAHLPFHLAQIGYFNNRGGLARITGLTEHSQLNILVNRSRLAEVVIQRLPRATSLPTFSVGSRGHTRSTPGGKENA